MHARRATNVYTHRVLDTTRRRGDRPAQAERILFWIEGRHDDVQ